MTPLPVSTADHHVVREGARPIKEIGEIKQLESGPTNHLMRVGAGSYFLTINHPKIESWRRTPL